MITEVIILDYGFRRNFTNLLGQLWGEMTTPLQSAKEDIVAGGILLLEHLDGIDSGLPAECRQNMEPAIATFMPEGNPTAISQLLLPENAEAVNELAACLQRAGEIAARLAGVTSTASEEMRTVNVQVYDGTAAAEKFAHIVL